MPAPGRRQMFALCVALATTGLAGCSDMGGGVSRNETANLAIPAGSAQIHKLVDHYAAVYDVPASLVHRVVKRESGYNPAARNGTYYGLMQIAPATAGTMGYSGAPAGLLDAETNLKYAVKYLRGAWMVSDGNQDKAVMWYSKGYYYEAKRRGLLSETGLRG